MNDLPRGGGVFPPTRHSVIAAVAASDRETRLAGFGSLVEVYWKPVYKYTRLRWHVTPDEAEDLTQGFFVRALDKNFFGSYDATRARFRTFLRTCLDGFVANARQAEVRLKRGGGVRFIQLDVATAESELRRQQDGVPRDLDAYFEDEWVRSVLTTAVDRFRALCDARGHQHRFHIFERYDLRDPDDTAGRVSYADIARELGRSATEVTNDLAAARRDFRRVALDCLRELTASDEEFRAEARRLLGIRL